MNGWYWAVDQTESRKRIFRHFLHHIFPFSAFQKYRVNSERHLFVVSRPTVNNKNVTVSSAECSSLDSEVHLESHGRTADGRSAAYIQQYVGTACHGTTDWPKKIIYLLKKTYLKMKPAGVANLMLLTRQWAFQ